MEYYTMTTDAGDLSIANAIQTGVTKTFKQIAVGDGNGTYYEPAKSQTALHHEVWRGDAEVFRDTDNAKRVVVMVTIPATVGGFTIREAGVFDTDNTLMVISKMPLSEKVAPESGASSDMIVRLYVEVSDAGAVTVTIDPSAITATKGDVKKAADDAAADLKTHEDNAVAHITGDERTKWNNKAEKSDIPTVPSSIKNPNPLNVYQGYGGQAGSYDGSAAMGISIPHVTVNAASPSATLADGELYGVY